MVEMEVRGYASLGAEDGSREFLRQWAHESQHGWQQWTTDNQAHERAHSVHSEQIRIVVLCNDPASTRSDFDKVKMQMNNSVRVSQTTGLLNASHWVSLGIIAS